MTEARDEQKSNRRRGRKGKIDESDDIKFVHNSVLIKFDGASTWYEYGKDLPGREATVYSDPPQASHQSNHDLVSKYRAMADSIFQKEIQFAGKNTGRGSDERWVENTMKKGTLKDRIAATSVTVSSDPLHKFYALDGLLSMAGCAESGGKSNSRVAQLSAQALEDLFINTLLPKHRKLIPLTQRPLYLFEASKNGKNSKKTLSPRILLLWRFEEMIKSKYELFLRNYMSHTFKEGVEMHKIATLQSAAALLVAIPEGESQLLAMIVNKLGDPGKKTAAAAGHQLRLIVQKHPNMQLVIAREVQQLAHRSHLSPKALYNCIAFLNQLKLDKKEEPTKPGGKPSETLPASLIKTYFRLFEVAVQGGKKTSKESDKGMKSRLLSALLTGVNRAHPYLPEKDQDMDEHVDALYRVVHTATPAASTQALMLLFHLTAGSTTTTMHRSSSSEAGTARQDRFYRALYISLSRQSLVSQGKHLTMFFNLLYKAMKCDSDSNRVNACAKRLMSTALHSSAATIAGSVFLLNEIAKTHPRLRICFQKRPNEADSKVVLDDTKREPRAALVRLVEDREEDSNRNSDEKEVEKCPPSWELALISHHAHPSVSKFASTIGNIAYTGDPLKDFGLTPFLDKFAYRNPKSREKVAGHYKRGQSVAERRSGTENQIQSRLDLPVNDPAFLAREDVSEQDEFFHMFFVERARRDEIKGITRKGEDVEMVEDEPKGAEDIALEAAEEIEGVDIGAKTFEDYSQAWESDPEEEAFADSLAEQLMVDTAEGQADYDDEDPNMSDWSDVVGDHRTQDGAGAAFDSSSEDEMTDHSESNSSNEGGSRIIGDDDGFMDDDSDSDGVADDADAESDFPTTFADAEEFRTAVDESFTKLKRSVEPTVEAGGAKKKRRKLRQKSG